MWGRRRDGLTNNFTLAVYMQFLVAADNGKRYADNWLENLLVSGSMNGIEQDPQNPL